MASGFYNMPKVVDGPVKQDTSDGPELKELLGVSKKMCHDEIDIPF